MLSSRPMIDRLAAATQAESNGKRKEVHGVTTLLPDFNSLRSTMPATPRRRPNPFLRPFETKADTMNGLRKLKREGSHILRLTIRISAKYRQAFRQSFDHKSKLCDLHATKEKSMLNGTDQAYTTLLKAGDLGRAAARLFGPFLLSSEIVRKKMRHTLEEIDINYREGPLAVDHGGSDGPRADERMLDSTVVKMPGNQYLCGKCCAEHIGRF